MHSWKSRRAAWSQVAKSICAEEEHFCQQQFLFEWKPTKGQHLLKTRGKPSFFASFICQNTKDVVRRNHPQHSSTKKVFKFTSTIYWKKCLDILIIEKGLHGDWNGKLCFPTTALFDGRSYWRDAKWSLTFPETSRWWLSCHSWQGRGEARPKRFRHPTSRQETLHYPRQSGGIATQKGFFFKHWI